MAAAHCIFGGDIADKAESVTKDQTRIHLANVHRHARELLVEAPDVLDYTSLEVCALELDDNAESFDSGRMGLGEGVSCG